MSLPDERPTKLIAGRRATQAQREATAAPMRHLRHLKIVPRGTSAAGRVLLQDEKSRAERLDERIRGCPAQGWCERIGHIGASGTTKQEQLSSGPEEGLKRDKRPRFQSDGANRQKVQRLVKLRASEQLLETTRFDFGAAESEIPQSLAEKNGLTGLGLDQPQMQSRCCEREGNRRGAAAGPDVDRMSCGPSDVLRGDQRLNEQTINRL